MARLRRFLHIERPRTDGAAADDPARRDTAERFEGVERRPAAAPGPPATGAELDRFGPKPPPRIELLETASGERPFTRCMRCGMDHNVRATECTGCGASLDTEPQRAFNDRLWAQRQEEAAREAAASEELRAARADADAEAARARRAMVETLAREVGERERRRLDAELGPSARRVAIPVADLLRRVWRTLSRRLRGGGDPAP
jgi:hypothetical protein